MSIKEQKEIWQSNNRLEIRTKGNMLIATVQKHLPINADNEANAKLIAAAPDLLDACECALAALPDIVFAESQEQKELIRSLNKAKAKAKGE